MPKDLQIKREVSSVCELLGLDPLYLANEGKVLAFVGINDSDAIKKDMKAHILGKNTAIIGEITKKVKGVYLF